MSRKFGALIVVAHTAILGGAGLYFVYSYNSHFSPKSPVNSKQSTEKKSTTSIGGPSEQVTYPDGRTTPVVAHTLIARISNAETVKSFGSSIHPSTPSGVYTITVSGDLLKEAELGLEAPGSIGLDDSNDFTNRPMGRYRDKHMEMILVGANGSKDNVRVVLIYLLDLQLEIGQYTPIENFATVFGRKHNMIVAEEDAV